MEHKTKPERNASFSGLVINFNDVLDVPFLPRYLRVNLHVALNILDDQFICPVIRQTVDLDLT